RGCGCEQRTGVRVTCRGTESSAPGLEGRRARLSGANGAAKENIVHIIGWIVFGLVVGVVAKFLMPGRDPGGFVITAILGIVGALVGGFVGRLIGWYGEGDPVGFIMAVVGSIILLAIYRFAFVRPARA